MTTRVGINGFGRIGRQVLKAIGDYYGSELQVVALNDITDTETCAHLLKYDSNYGAFNGTIEARESELVVNGHAIKVTAERDPARIPWGSLGVDIVIESTGLFTDAAKAAAHIAAGAKRVIISAPSSGEDITVVMGVNDSKYDPAKHKVISCGSCTTNCLLPVAKVLLDEFGIVRGLMTTIHAYTNDQVIMDRPHKDLRRARAAALSMIPTSTGAAKAASVVLPELKGRFHGIAVRVPTSTVSLVDLVVETEKPASVEAVNDAMRRAAAGPLKGILAVSDEPLVSVDFKGNAHSSIVDAALTISMGDTMVKVLSWYDNEWAYSVRVSDMTALIARKGA